VASSARLAQDEVFGPVLAVMPFDGARHAAEIANGTRFGLIAAVWTEDLTTAHWLSRTIRAGQIFVNSYGAGGGVELPFGGYGKSGHGREKGVEGLLGYTQTKSVVMRTGEPPAG
jgi:aldehyde dehydrogenase (NAD+)/betaine-aldehyde dehydrogenase